MIKQKAIDWNTVSDFISTIGNENIIAIIPLMYTYYNENNTNNCEENNQTISNIITTKYLILYNT